MFTYQTAVLLIFIITLNNFLNYFLGKGRNIPGKKKLRDGGCSDTILKLIIIIIIIMV